MRINFIIEIIGYMLIALLPGLMFGALLIAYIKMRKCTEIIQGKCIKINKFNSTYPTYSAYYEIKFSYCYNRKKYEEWSLDRFVKKPKNFVEGESYSLFLNPQKPYIIRCRKQTMSISQKINFVVIGLIAFVCVSGVIMKFVEWIQSIY